ncbi:AtzG-like protein [Gluconobacter morbifer]|nr:AtzG-like protein [Gluconobacter morbifer]
MTPMEDPEITALAAANRLTIDPRFHEGVRQNLTLLRSYAELIEGLDLPERLEPAFEYVP